MLLLWMAGCAAPPAVDISYQPHEDQAELKDVLKDLSIKYIPADYSKTGRCLFRRRLLKHTCYL